MVSVTLAESGTEHSEKENAAPQNRRKHNSVWFLMAQVHVTLPIAHLKRSQAKQSTPKFLVLPDGPRTWKWPPHVHTILAQDKRRSDRNSRLHPAQHILKLWAQGERHEDHSPCYSQPHSALILSQQNLLCLQCRQGFF